MTDRPSDAAAGHEPSTPEDPWDLAWRSAVQPADWPNPTPRSRYHLVVVGAGTAGLVCAAIAAGLGAQVALVERARMGGDCLNAGCVPSKALLSAARSWHTAREAERKFGGPPVTGAGDFGAVMARLRRLRAELAPVDGAARFAGLGVDVFLGEGRFVARDTVVVGKSRLRFKKAVIATGGRPALPAIPGLAAVPYLTHESLFALTELPPRLAIVGGGPIGCEMAQAFARFGSEVHLFQTGTRLLARDDADAAAILAQRLAAEGVHLHLATQIQQVAAVGAPTRVEFWGPEGAGIQEVDRLLIATGRTPNLEGLGLAAAGVEVGEDGIVLDARLRTSNRQIFALGDVVNRLQFTHHADAQARLVVQNALFFGRRRRQELVLPWCTYTSPEIAQVGLTAEEAGRQGIAIDTLRIDLAEVDRALLDGQAEGFLKVHLAKGRDRIVGATLVAEHAGEQIGHLTLAMTHGLGLAQLGATLFPYPTQSEIFRKAADRWNRGRLTPGLRRLLRGFFRFWPGR